MVVPRKVLLVNDTGAGVNPGCKAVKAGYNAFIYALENAVIADILPLAVPVFRWVRIKEKFARKCQEYQKCTIQISKFPQGLWATCA